MFSRGSFSPLIVARIHASAALRAGIVAVVRFEAIAADGSCCASRVVTMLAADPGRSKPRTWRAARAAVAPLRRDVEEGNLTPTTIRAWFEQVRENYGRSRRAYAGREAKLATASAEREELQPGLFDSRAVQERERRRAAEAERDAEHQQRLRALVREGMELRASLTAALIVWR